MPSIYLYRRVSTEKQTHKSGLEIQVTEHTINKLQNEYPDFTIVNLESDEGKSGFAGEHLEEGGSLKAFIDLCEQNKIEKGSILAVYSLDRLSRLKLGDAHRKVFIPIVENGVRIFTETENRLYADNDTDYLIASILFSRANEESRTKSRRINDTIFNAVTKWQESRTFTPKLTKAPFWIDNETGKFNEWHGAARFIIDSMIDGVGYTNIIKELKETYPKKALQKKARRESFWVSDVLTKMRKDPVLIGNKTIKMKIEGSKWHKTKNSKEWVLEGYYPALVTAKEWQALQAIRSTKQRSEPNIYLVSDLNAITKCKLCGYTWYAKKSSTTPYYYCGGAFSKKSDHTLYRLNAELFERCVVLMSCSAIQQSITDSKNNRKEELARLEIEQQSLLKSIDTLKSKYEETLSDSILDLLNNADKKIKLNQSKIEEINGQATIQKQGIKQFLELYRTPDLWKDFKHPIRVELKKLLATVLANVSIDVLPRSWVFTVTLKNGKVIEFDTSKDAPNVDIIEGSPSDPEYIGMKFQGAFVNELLYQGMYHYMDRKKNTFMMKAFIEDEARKVDAIKKSKVYISHPDCFNELIKDYTYLLNYETPEPTKEELDQIVAYIEKRS